MKKVLIIGSGYRVESVILPALYGLRGELLVSAVYSKSSKSLILGKKLGLDKTITTLDKIDFSKIDLIIVAVPIHQVKKILVLLSSRDLSHVVLMLDTPVMAFRDILAVRYFKNFKNVLISEDTIALPPFILARKLIEDGRIGSVHNVVFFHNGYKYHALASLKMLVGDENILSIRSQRLQQGYGLKRIKFSKGVEASLFEPRDYTKGKFIIQGEKGMIVDYEHANKKALSIGYLAEGGIYKGLTLDGIQIPHDEIDKKYLSIDVNDMHDPSLMNSMKIRGFMDLLMATADEQLKSKRYSPSEGIFDSLAIYISEQGYFKNLSLKRFLDIFINRL